MSPILPFTTSPLSANDAAILSTLLDPESAPSSFASSPFLTTPTLPSFPTIPPSILSSLQAAELAILRPLNILRPSLAQLNTALESLSRLIAQNPDYAPAYNNRAQVLRMLHGDDLGEAGLRGSCVLGDLRKAIELAGPKGAGQGRVGMLQGRVLAGAFTQRGWVYWRTARGLGEGGELVGLRLGAYEDGSREDGCKRRGGRSGEGEEEEEEEEAEGEEEPRKREEEVMLSKERLEEMASVDFAMGAKYGNEIARAMAVGANPYARLCGSIVQEALKKEMGGDRRDGVGVKVERLVC